MPRTVDGGRVVQGTGCPVWRRCRRGEPRFPRSGRLSGGFLPRQILPREGRCAWLVRLADPVLARGAGRDGGRSDLLPCPVARLGRTPPS